MLALRRSTNYYPGLATVQGWITLFESTSKEEEELKNVYKVDTTAAIYSFN